MSSDSKLKILAILVEPANYTLDLIRNFYDPRGISHVFIKQDSLAGKANSDFFALDSLPIARRVRKIYELLKSFAIFNLNGYTGITCFLFILLNVVFFKKPFSIDSDTELIIPHNPIKRCIKWVWLHFLFTREYCYGFAGGSFGHKDLFLHYGMSESRIFLAPMVVDNAKYKRLREVDCFERGRPFRFGYVGRLVELKQVDSVISAFKTLVDNGINAELEIIGDGPLRKKLEEMSEGLSVNFFGSIYGNDKIRAIHRLDCLVLYSHYESWGLVVNEALASGVPVIVSDRVGARRDLVEGESPTGLVAKWNDIDDLAAKLWQMVVDVGTRRNMANDAVARMSTWDYGLYAKGYDSFLEKTGALA